MSSDILEGLNLKQREAVETIEGPVLIVAGPGSGKTRAITRRIAHLVQNCGVPPYRVAAVTFTNKAAREMRERLNSLMGVHSQDLTVGTFHAFCARILRREGQNIQVNSNFSIFDDVDQIVIIKRAMKELNVDPKRYGPRTVQSVISSAKSQLVGVEGFALKNETYFDEIVSRIYERYDQLLTQSSGLDFDDLLLKVYILLRDYPSVAKKYEERYFHLMVDEFQDTNIAQYEISKQLAQGHRNLCVVGDPDQAIYSWRNADIRNILSFQSDFPEAKEIAFEENYRSTQTILDAASHVIESNERRVEKNLWTKNGQGAPITVIEGYDGHDEALYVAREVQNLLVEEGYSWRDIAVMYRVNAQSRVLEETCLRHGIPYQIVGSLKFYHRQEIKDITAYLRLVANTHDDASFARVVNLPTRGIGQRTLGELARLAMDYETSLFGATEILSSSDDTVASLVQLPARSIKALKRFHDLVRGLSVDSQSLSLVDLIDAILERTGYKQKTLGDADRGEERWENIIEYRDSTEEFTYLGARNDLMAFLESISLVNDTDNMDEGTDAITMITLHQAKGLEFPVVFIVGMEEGVLPHIRSMDDPDQIEEERRLCYVGVTRAKERLYLTRAFRRGFRGSSEPNESSRFLSDIPKKLVTTSKATPTHGLRSLSRAQDSVRTDLMGVSGRASIVDEPARAKMLRTESIKRTERARDGSATGLVLSTGDKVRHATFGEGIVTGIKPLGADVEVTVAFKDGLGVKRLLLGFAPLERLDK